MYFEEKGQISGSVQSGHVFECLMLRSTHLNFVWTYNGVFHRGLKVFLSFCKSK